MFEWLGIESETECEEDEEDCIVEGNQESTFDQLAVVLIAAFAISILCLVLILLRLLLIFCPKVKQCFQNLKNKLIYGTFIRYVLLSSLKIQITLCFGLAIGDLIEVTPTKPAKDSSFVIVASTLLGALSLAPLLLGIILYRERRVLNEP